MTKFSYEIEHDYDHILLRLAAQQVLLGIIGDSVLAVYTDVKESTVRLIVFTDAELSEAETEDFQEAMMLIHADFYPTVLYDHLEIKVNCQQPFEGGSGFWVFLRRDVKVKHGFFAESSRNLFDSLH